MTTNPKEPKMIRLKGGSFESELVVDQFLEALNKLQEDNTELFTHFVRACHDSEYEIPTDFAACLIGKDYMRNGGKGKKPIIASSSLRNVTIAATEIDDTGVILLGSLKLYGK